MRIPVVQVRGTDQHGQEHLIELPSEEHVNAVRAEFIERMQFERGLQLTGVKARKVGEVEVDDD